MIDHGRQLGGRTLGGAREAGRHTAGADGRGGGQPDRGRQGDRHPRRETGVLVLAVVLMGGYGMLNGILGDGCVG